MYVHITKTKHTRTTYLCYVDEQLGQGEHHGLGALPDVLELGAGRVDVVGRGEEDAL